MTGRLTNAIRDKVRIVLRKSVNVVQEHVTLPPAVIAVLTVLVELQNAVLGRVHQEVNAALLLSLVQQDVDTEDKAFCTHALAYVAQIQAATHHSPSFLKWSGSL